MSPSTVQSSLQKTPQAELPRDESQPRVTIVCAWYNRSEFLLRTVDSLLSQDFDDYEVVIVNDGSTDPRVRELLDGCSDSRLKVIHQENAGFVRAISRAVNYCKSPFIAIQGSGDISYPS